MRISDGISDVCSSDLHRPRPPERDLTSGFRRRPRSLTGPAILLEFPPLRTGPGFPGFNMAVTKENQLTITLPDGSTRAFEGPVTGAEVAAAIGPGLATAALAVKTNGPLRDPKRRHHRAHAAHIVPPRPAHHPANTRKSTGGEKRVT